MENLSWGSRPAPSISDFEDLAATAWERLPERFRAACAGVVIKVEDFATDDVLAQLEIESPFDLMGLFQGVSLDKQSVLDSGTMPNMVFLYRRPILDFWAEGDEMLQGLVAHVLIHELGHHFGFSDEDMETIEAETAAGGDT